MPIQDNFVKDTVITFITKILTVLLFAAIAIIIARVLGPSKQGIYSLTILFPAFLLTFVNFGISQASVYCICRKKHNPETVLGNNIICALLIGVITAVIGGIIVLFFGETFFPGVDQKYLFLAFILIPFQLFLSYTNNILLGLGRIVKFNMTLFLQPLLFLLILTIFLLMPGREFGIGAAILAEIISLALIEILLLFWAVKQTGKIYFHLDKDYLREVFSFGGKVYATNIFSFISQRAGVFILNIFIGSASAGFYAVAAGLAEKLLLFSQSAETILFPKIASEKNKNKLKVFTPLVCRNLIFITSMIAVFFFIIGHWLIIFLFSDAYMPTVAPFQILLWGIIIVSGSKILANDIAGRGKPAINACLAGVAALINVILNIALVPFFGAVGAAWSATISYAVLFGGQIAAYIAISGNNIKDILFIKKSDLVYYLFIARLLCQKIKLKL